MSRRMGPYVLEFSTDVTLKKYVCHMGAVDSVDYDKKLVVHLQGRHTSRNGSSVES